MATSLLTVVANTASAAPKLRVQVSQHGDFVLLGNTLGQECILGTPLPVVGVVGNCGTIGIADSAPDVYWRADSPLDATATADNSIAGTDARSTAVLTVPLGATITHAYLYWAATLPAAGTDPTVTLDRVGGFTQDIDAGTDCYQSVGATYQCLADVTSLVQTNGEGAYRVSGVNSAPLVDINNSGRFAGWYMIVLYALPADPLRNLAIFDGLDAVTQQTPQNAVLDGFLVPNGGISGKLGLAVFEGDSALGGDQFSFGANPVLSNLVNPADNFFNGSRSYLGAPVSNVGDLPQLLGTPGSMSGIDLDVVDVTAKLTAGQTMAPIKATSTQDQYYLAAFVTSISDFRPDFTTSIKTAEDINGGALLPGDTLEYTIVATNTGNDAGIDVVLTDALPAGVTFVPGSLQISDGPNNGAKTDDLGDDQGEYDDGTKTVLFRLGAMADGVNGGKLAIGESSTVKFQVTIDADTQGSIENQGLINAAGEMGAPPTDTPTDGNGGDDGAPPTGSVVDQCGEDADCTDPNTPLCFTDLDPNQCVQCIADADCGPLTPTCDQGTNSCTCVPNGDEVCDGMDNDCNGTADDGFGTGEPCSAGIGECAADGSLVCDGPDATVCDAVPGEPSAELCDELDNDCDNEVDNECIACDVDADCGADDSGKVCDDSKMCIDGCRGSGGNGCPDGMMCTSDDDTIGTCVPASDTDTADTTDTATLTDTDTNTDTATATDTDSGVSDSDTRPTEGSATNTNTNPTEGDSESESNSNSDSETTTLGIDDEGFGCECSSNGQNSGGGLLLLGLAGLTLGTRRRRRA